MQQGLPGAGIRKGTCKPLEEASMATKFEELINGMVNVGFGVAATAAEMTHDALEDFAEKGEQVRKDKQTPDFARSVSDAFEQAGGTFSEVTERLSQKGETTAERVLDELILARVRALTKSERVAFMAHVRDLVDSVDDNTVTVEVTVEVEEESGDDSAAQDGVAEGVDSPVEE